MHPEQAPHTANSSATRAGSDPHSAEGPGPVTLEGFLDAHWLELLRAAEYLGRFLHRYEPVGVLPRRERIASVVTREMTRPMLRDVPTAVLKTMAAAGGPDADPADTGPMAAVLAVLAVGARHEWLSRVAARN